MHFILQTMFQKAPWKSLGSKNVVVKHIMMLRNV
jgi:hypothetical protein